MGRIRVLPDHVANQIAAGEVVDRPASVVKELLENALDAGATRIRIEVEAGGRKLIRITDNGHGMNRDDALLAFERHATSKLRTADDLLSISTLGFRGEALPSIASVARVTLVTSEGGNASDKQPNAGIKGARNEGTRIEIHGGKIMSVEDVAAPRGTTFTVEDLFYNTPARRKFLRAESTELSHVTALVTHYALVHPEKHFELISATHTLVSAPPVTRTAERIYQIFGKETLSHLLPVAAEEQLERTGLPEPPPWKQDPAAPKRAPGALHLEGFFSKPELQKLNRNSIYIFVNQRLIRDRTLLHAITEAYRNVLPPQSYPVVLLFLEMPPEEVDVNVHPAKTEVRFRQQSRIHDFVRDSLRKALVAARPAAAFPAPSDAHISSTLMPPPAEHLPYPASTAPQASAGSGYDAPAPRNYPGTPQSLRFTPADTRPSVNWRDAVELFRPLTPQEEEAAPIPAAAYSEASTPSSGPVAPELLGNLTRAIEMERTNANLDNLGDLRPLGQLHNSFILAVGPDSLWIIDQHVAHERILFEKILNERETETVQRQRLLMPLLVELQPAQMVVFAQIAEELEQNGFEVEPFGPRTLAVKAAPPGLEGRTLERMLTEVIDFASSLGTQARRSDDLAALRARIAASMSCHAAVKVNMPLDQQKMEWLLRELATTSHPTNCPHGRPIALRYPLKAIEKAFERI